MKFVKAILVLILSLMFSVVGAWTQTASSATKSDANAAPNPPKSYRLTYTLTEMDGNKRSGTQHFSMIVVTGRKTVLKQGSKVPIATGTSTNGGGAQTQVQYLDVGLIIEAQLDESVDGVKLNDGVRLSTRVEQSSIAEEKSGVGMQDPIVRQTALEGSSILAEGRPLMLGSMDIPGSTRHLDVEVVMEPVAQ